MWFLYLWLNVTKLLLCLCECGWFVLGVRWRGMWLDWLTIDAHERLDVGQGEEDESELIRVFYYVEIKL